MVDMVKRTLALVCSIPSPSLVYDTVELVRMGVVELALDVDVVDIVVVGVVAFSPTLAPLAAHWRWLGARWCSPN